MELDFSNINELAQMHQLLKEKFGFPDFYGKNVNALIDC
ncbi:barstar family protein [Chitinophaga sp. 212800010-3]